MSDQYGLPEHGWIDIHSHLLPGIDDGCSNLDESLECVQRLLQRGFVGTVCTPHFWPFHFPQNSPDRIAAAVAKLAKHFEARGIRYQLWTGAEIRIDEDTVSWLKRWGVPTLGPSRCVLVDYWGLSWPRCADELLDFLLEQNYQPILAHPERMGFEDDHMLEVLRSVEKRGVWLQGNFNSLTGNEGRNAERWVRTLLEERRYRVMALDMHQPVSLPGRFKGMTQMEDEFGPELLVHLLHDRPREVLSHQTSTPVNA